MDDRELIKQEILHCAKDYIYMLKKYGQIIIAGKGVFKFSLYNFQEKVLQLFLQNQNTIILKGRQLGLSTLVAGYIACEMLFKPKFQTLIVATKQETAINMIRKVKTFIRGFPSWLLSSVNANIIVDNAKSIELSNGAITKAVGHTEDIGRSEGLSLLVLDEAAFIRRVDELWAGMSETLSTTGGKSIILSTPNGVGNWFHKMFIEAEEGNNGFAFMTLPWYLHPDRDENWKQERLRVLGEQKFAQEHDCSFISSGRTLIPGSLITEIEQQCQDPIDKVGPEDNFWIWNWPLTGRKYLIAADVATEGGEDFCAAHIFDIEDCIQVAEFKGHIPPADFGEMLVVFAQQYNEAMLVIENNSLGIAAIQPAIDRNYRNLLWTIRGGIEYIDPINNPFDLDNKEARPGFSTTRRVRPLMIQKLEDYLREKSITINSKRTVAELWTFVYESGKIQAMHGYHDDLIMSMAIALWTRDTVLKLKSLTDEFDRKRNNWIMYRSVTGSGDGIYISNQTIDPYKINVGRDTEDLRWLI